MPRYDYDDDDTTDRTQLEDEYKQLVTDHGLEIKRLVKQSQVLLDEAVKLAEKYSIPFSGPVEDYIPQSLVNSKFNDLSWDDIEKITGEYIMRGYDNNDYGWMNSSSSC